MKEIKDSCLPLFLFNFLLWPRENEINAILKKNCVQKMFRQIDPVQTIVCILQRILHEHILIKRTIHIVWNNLSIETQRENGYKQL